MGRLGEGAALESRVANFYRRAGALLLPAKQARRALGDGLFGKKWVNSPSDFWGIGDMLTLPPPEPRLPGSWLRRLPRRPCLVSVTTFGKRNDHVQAVLTRTPRPSEFEEPIPLSGLSCLHLLIERGLDIELWAAREGSKEKPDPLWVVQRWFPAHSVDAVAGTEVYEVPFSLRGLAPFGWTRAEAEALACREWPGEAGLDLTPGRLRGTAGRWDSASNSTRRR